MNGNSMKEKLEYTFSNVNEWLKYSEAKSGVLLTLNGAVLMVFISIMKDTSGSLKNSLNWGLFPTFTISLIILLISFLPIRDKFFKRKHDLSNITLENINLIYFGDLRKLTVPTYLNLLYQSYKKEIPESFEKTENDLAQQILNNSAIAYRKLSLFTISAYIDFLGVLIGILIFILT